jgi:NAD(P)-dependent dehydrogenase (short-subunit alcohol dehydrogenase family)
MNETILITGANRGIGLALTKLSLLKGLNVEACCRSSEKSDVLKKLSFQYSNLNIHEMDVTSSSSIERVSHEIKVEIDILVCNAGLNNGKGGLFSDDHDEKSIMDVMMVNVGGPFLTIKNLYNNLKKNNGSRVVIISSLMGSQTHSSSNAPIYRASKAAANNLMRTLSSELFEHGIAVASYHPGWVRTDMGGENADISTEESASSLLAQFMNLDIKKTGGFFNYDGNKLPL